MKKIIVFGLSLVMIACMFPASAMAEGGEPEGKEFDPEKIEKVLDDDVFADIDIVKKEYAAKFRQGDTSALTDQDYIDMVPEVIKVIKNSETYAEGTLQENGYFLVWETTTGMPCCYSPSMEARLNGNDPDIKSEVEFNTFVNKSIQQIKKPHELKSSPWGFANIVFLV